ncbi:uncharacterized protein N7459_005635 [Penicillium hispanicum]|uniref:uncharacterized protein n=1 Tax=Penicillium hispanicum TaxID=1080232 RepID=UPI002540D313|nr:uncharacterized protein N7459_005635 [Penicillium hispanicum]KAJ5579650.1 hypothetical protein N7459_005635 [Penicillium hispanicum]
MERVVIVGAGLYGLITAKTYLQVTGAYDNQRKTDNTTGEPDNIPNCFTSPRNKLTDTSGCSLLVIDAASDIGGTWAGERLYPNLLSQNSYGLYEFSDMSLAETISDEEKDKRQQFIPGWQINRYLHAWAKKWDLRKHIRLGWRVDSIRRLESKEWDLTISLAADPSRRMRLVCDKLILATGLTSVPNLPSAESNKPPEGSSAPVIHAKDFGRWARTHLGYEALAGMEEMVQPKSQLESGNTNLRSVAIYGGAKSSFDLVHFFATIHHNDPALRLKLTPKNPVQVHWIIREKGTGPAWMVPPTSALPNGEVVASDKAASTRSLHHLSPCSYEIPKRICLQSGRLHMEGSWLARVFHGNPIGRWLMRWFWKSVDRGLEGFAQYGANSKLQLLRPNKSVISCGSSIGIANQRDLWDAIKLPHVKIYRATINAIARSTTGNVTETSERALISLNDGVIIRDVDLVIHATGYKPIVPIKLEPPSFRLTLGLSGLVHETSSQTMEVKSSDPPDTIHIPMDSATKDHVQYWKILDQHSETTVRQTLTATGCALEDVHKASWAGGYDILPYRLFRRMVAPSLVAEGDRSFAILGVVLTSTIAVVAEVQALWVTAFLTGGFDVFSDSPHSHQYGPLCLEMLGREAMDRTISEDVVLGSLTGTGLEVDAIHYNDMLMRDLGLNPHRLGGGFMRELTGVYEPSVYAGIVDEWRTRRGHSTTST